MNVMTTEILEETADHTAETPVQKRDAAPGAADEGLGEQECTRRTACRRSRHGGGVARGLRRRQRRWFGI